MSSVALPVFLRCDFSRRITTPRDAALHGTPQPDSTFHLDIFDPAPPRNTPRLATAPHDVSRLNPTQRFIWQFSTAAPLLPSSRHRASPHTTLPHSAPHYISTFHLSICPRRSAPQHGTPLHIASPHPTTPLNVSFVNFLRVATPHSALLHGTPQHAATRLNVSFVDLPTLPLRTAHRSTPRHFSPRLATTLHIAPQPDSTFHLSIYLRRRTAPHCATLHRASLCISTRLNVSFVDLSRTMPHSTVHRITALLTSTRLNVSFVHFQTSLHGTAHRDTARHAARHHYAPPRNPTQRFICQFTAPPHCATHHIITHRFSALLNSAQRNGLNAHQSPTL